MKWNGQRPGASILVSSPPADSVNLYHCAMPGSPVTTQLHEDLKHWHTVHLDECPFISVSALWGPQRQPFESGGREWKEPMSRHPVVLVSCEDTGPQVMGCVACCLVCNQTLCEGLAPTCRPGHSLITHFQEDSCCPSYSCGKRLGWGSGVGLRC